MTHSQSTNVQLELSFDPLCACGCGNPVNQWKKGNARYLMGHHLRKSPIDYVIEDRGYVTPCWIWQRATNGVGYGHTTVNGRRVYVHRYLYEQKYGPIPDGLELDHLCRVRGCVCPDHVEPVTHLENVLRGNSPAAVAIRTGLCAKGHRLTEDNIITDKHGKRRCLACRRWSSAVAVERRRRGEGKRITTWSLNYDACIDCGRTDRPYAAAGRCNTCRMRVYRETRH